MLPRWVTSFQRQCEEQSVLMLFKQWGAYGEDGQRRAKRLNGRQLGGRTWDAMPVLETGDTTCSQSTLRSL